ncbi:hypothetical protein BIWAKO_00214 [Bosea sp. BIWAKO-01]|nr:hypothetical protein BIWAKO_00214 [Bosea sp. BIWAKO-01]
MKHLLPAALLALGCQGAQAADRFEPGLWRSSALIDGKTERRTGPRCVTDKEAQTMNGSAASIRGALEASPDWKACSIRDVRADGDSVAFSAVCADAVTTSQTRYQPSSYSGTITVTQPGAPTMTMSIKGERVGSCP